MWTVDTDTDQRGETITESNREMQKKKKEKENRQKSQVILPDDLIVNRISFKSLKKIKMIYSITFYCKWGSITFHIPYSISSLATQATRYRHNHNNNNVNDGVTRYGHSYLFIEAKNNTATTAKIKMKNIYIHKQRGFSVYLVDSNRNPKPAASSRRRWCQDEAMKTTNNSR